MILSRSAEATRPRLTPPSLLNKAERAIFLETVRDNPHLRTSNVPILAAYAQTLANTYRLARLSDAASVKSWEQTTGVMMALATKLRITSQSQIRAVTAGRHNGKGPTGPQPWEEED